MGLIIIICLSLLFNSVYSSTWDKAGPDAIKTSSAPSGTKMLIPCSECEGYTKPSRDPRCAFGCGSTDIVYPKGVTKSPFTLHPWISKTTTKIAFQKPAEEIPLPAERVAEQDGHINIIIGLSIALIAALALIIILMTRIQYSVTRVVKHKFIPTANLNHLQYEDV